MTDFTTLTPQQVRDFHKVDMPHLPIEQLARQTQGGNMTPFKITFKVTRSKTIEWIRFAKNIEEARALAIKTLDDLFVKYVLISVEPTEVKTI